MPHFAHKSLKDCDDFKHDMSAWHKSWQEQFPLECREVVVRNNGEVHRADVLWNGVVFEFQHSPISSDEFNRRNRFYVRAGYKVIWIFDMRNLWNRRKIYQINSYSGKSIFAWEQPITTFKFFKPQYHDLVSVYFQFLDHNFEDKGAHYIERVRWAPEGHDGTNFYRFATDLNACCNIYTLLYAIQHNIRYSKSGSYYV